MYAYIRVCVCVRARVLCCACVRARAPVNGFQEAGGGRGERRGRRGGPFGNIIGWISHVDNGDSLVCCGAIAVRVYVCVRERESVCVCVCERERVRIECV